MLSGVVVMEFTAIILFAAIALWFATEVGGEESL